MENFENYPRVTLMQNFFRNINKIEFISHTINQLTVFTSKSHPTLFYDTKVTHSQEFKLTLFAKTLDDFFSSVSALVVKVTLYQY